MTNRMMFRTAGTAALATVAALGFARTARAQEPARLAFGYQCDDRFGLRNEGSTAVDVDFEVLGGDERGSLHLEPNQTLDIVPREMGDVQISVAGQVVATAQHGSVACQSAPVIVRPMYEPRMVTVVAPYYRPMPIFYGPVISVGYRAPGLRVGIGLGYPRYPVIAPRVIVRGGGYGYGGGYIPRPIYGGGDRYRGREVERGREWNRGGDRSEYRGDNRGGWQNRGGGENRGGGGVSRGGGENRGGGDNRGGQGRGNGNGNGDGNGGGRTAHGRSH